MEIAAIATFLNKYSSICYRRQFDNVKRIFKMVEEMPGSVTNNIKTHFLLSDDLARKYAAIVFIACLRFETTKRKLQYLNFSDFFECSQVMNRRHLRPFLHTFS